MDGNFMALVQTGFGTVYYYQLSSKGTSQQLWTSTRDHLVAAAAVNDDGSLVAVVDNDSVVVLNRQGNVVASGAKSRDSTGAMMFANDYLFVGTTVSLLPAYYWQLPTNKVDAYYVGALH
jgi:hypothetical protein